MPYQKCQREPSPLSACELAGIGQKQYLWCDLIINPFLYEESVEDSDNCAGGVGSYGGHLSGQAASY